MKKDKSLPLLLLGVLFAMLAVILGALGAHFLKAHLEPDQLDSFKTAVQYQMYHALALLIVFALYHHFPKRVVLLSGYFFIAGIICFSGSIYGFTLASLQDTSWPILGPITPLGGLLFIVGWFLLLVGVGWNRVEMSRKG